MNYNDQTIKILQYNTQKSRELMADAFNHHKIRDYDILAIQEPYRNRYQNTTHHPTKDRFHLLYFNSENTRTCFFINRRMDPGTWHVRYINEDICVLQLGTPNQEYLQIYNVYNEPGAESKTRTLEILEQELRKETLQDHILLLGDFNLHHPQWSGIQRRAPSRQARTLINITETFHLWQLTPRGLKTHRWPGNDTTLDLTFATHLLKSSLYIAKRPTLWTVIPTIFP